MIQTVESRINESQCSLCRRWFWRWEETRDKCLACDPPTLEQTKAALELIERGVL